MISLFLAVITTFLYLRKKYFPALIIFFYLLLDGFQIIPLDILTYGSFSGATIDSALFAFLALLIIRGRLWFKSPIISAPFAKVIFVFIIIVLVNGLYGLFVMDYSFGDVFKGGRLYLFLLSFLMFTEVPISVIQKTIKILVIITFFQSVLFLLQIITGHSILQGPKELEVEDLNYVRFYNTPKLLDFSTAVMLFWNPFEKLKKFRWLILSVFGCTILGPLNRGYLFSWFFSIGLVSILFNRLDRKIFYILSIVAVGFIILSISVVQKRIDEAVEELTVLESISSGHTILEDNTFTYRIQHLTERLDYISNQPLGWMFGIGLIDERAPQVSRLPLHYGLSDPVTGQIYKVYTPDIAWSMLFLTLGIVGTIVYVLIFIRMLLEFSNNKAIPVLGKVFFVLIILGFVNTFTSNTFIQPSFFIPLLLLAVAMYNYNYLIYKRKFKSRGNVKPALSFNNNSNL